MLLRLLYSILFFLASSNAFSQLIDEKDFIHYSLKEGLSDNYVSGIVQDSNGYLWIATHRGLNRFDGKIFKQFSQWDKYNAIPHNNIYSMRLLKKGNLAIATNDGAQIISTKTLEQLNLSIIDDEQLRYWSNACMSIFDDEAGNYGVSTKTGFYVFSPLGKIKKRFDHFTKKDIGEDWILFGDDIYQSADEDMMQLNKDGLLLYDRQKDQITNAVVKFPVLRSLVKEKNNNLFFQISGSELMHINIETNSFDLVNMHSGKIASYPSCIDFLKNIGWITAPAKINDSTWAINCKTKGFFLLTISPVTKIISCSPRRYFSDKLCTIVFSDHNNKLWVGTNEGLFKQNAHPKIIETLELNDHFQQDINITAVHVSDKLIFAGTDKNQVFVLDKKTKKFIRRVQFNVSAELSNYVTTFYLFHPDTLWVGTSSGLYWMNLQNFSTGKIVIDNTRNSRSIYLLRGDKKKNVWIATFSTNSIYQYNNSTRSFLQINDHTDSLFKTNTVSIAEDRHGNIWIGGDAIVRWNYAKNKIDTLIRRLPTQQNMRKGYWVMADSKGDIWTPVADEGLAKFTGNNIQVKPKNLIKEETSSMTPALIKDRIFMFTANGPGYFDILNSQYVVFSHNDGLPEIPVSTFFFADDATDGSVWFACKNTLCKIPSRPSLDYIKAPVLNITALSILNDTTLNYPSKKISLNHTQDNINIFFSAVNYIDPENMQFFYRIKNKKDSSWIEAGDQQNILLTNISPGSYEIEIRVAANDNKWSEQIKELEIDVRYPFWKTPFFLISVALIIVLIAYYLYRYRIRQIKQRANIDKQLAQTEMKALHSQMNPHFIFNCLNSIREMILHNENEQASLYLSKFAKLIRITLDHSSKSFVSLEDTVDYLQRYLEMEQIRKSNFKYVIDMDENLQPHEIFLPPMLIQPFIENAIWHGGRPNKEMHLTLRFKRESDKLVCIVEDDGIGIETSLKNKVPELNYQSVGISNIKKRIHVLNEKYNLKSTIEIEDKSNLYSNGNTGTIVTLRLPIKTNESVI